MAIEVGDRLPTVTLMQMTADGPKPLGSDELFAGAKVVLFGLPGAFTPTCSAMHLPGFVANADALRARGVDAIVCLSVNDAFVMDAWGKEQKVGDKVRMIADGNGDFTRAIGMQVDRSDIGLGERSKRYMMIVDDGVVSHLAEEPPGQCSVSRAESVLDLLG